MGDDRRNHLREVRNALFLTQAEVAKRANVSPVTYRAAENDDVRPDPRNMRKIAKALGVVPAWRIYRYDHSEVGRLAELREILAGLDGGGGPSRFDAMTAGLSKDERAFLAKLPAGASVQEAIEATQEHTKDLARTRKLVGAWIAGASDAYVADMEALYAVLSRLAREARNGGST
jgi:DNA-binding XRE family transcriptional regulator